MIGKTVTHYKILEKLGGGGMGIVYKAYDIQGDRFVALKFLPPCLAHNDQEKKRFAREAMAASALLHPNICTVYEVGETEDGQNFIVMTYCEGQTLKSLLSDRRLNIDETINFILQIAEGLKKAHDNKIIHRDIKPANIMVTNGGQVKIIDFGLAKVQDQTLLSQTSTLMGTVAYMSPEQLEGDKVDHRTDIWSVGVVLYEMLAGKCPYDSVYEQVLIFSILNNNINFSNISNLGFHNFRRIINKSLTKEKDYRYQDLEEFIYDVNNYKEIHVNKIRPRKKFKTRTLINLMIIIMYVIVLIGHNITYFRPVFSFFEIVEK